MEEGKQTVNGQGSKEQWLTNMTFACVKCNSSYRTRDELVAHYDSTRHDQYSSWA